MKRVLLVLLTLVVLVLGACDEVSNNGNVDNNNNDTNITINNNEPEEEASPKDIINQYISDKVETDYNNTSIKDIRINDDLGTGEGYIVLVDLSFNAKNRANTAKDMISMYSSDLAAALGKEFEEINQIVVFWEVPYLQESGNIAKIATERTDGGMAFTEQWYDHNIFD